MPSYPSRFVNKDNRLQRENHRGVGIKAWRLIVRNLNFRTKKEDLEEAFKHLGAIGEIVLPASKDPKLKKCCGGFGFVQFKTRESAERAIREMNSKEIKNRKIAIDFALDQDDFLGRNRMNGKEEEQEDPTRGVLEKMMAGGKRKNGETCGGLNSKKVKLEEPRKEVVFESEDEEEGTPDIKEEVGEEAADLEDLDNEEDEEDEEAEDEEEEEEGAEEAEAPVKAKNTKDDSAVLENRVIFVRNLHYDVMEDDLADAVDECGEIVLSTICKYKDSEHSMGTGFVHFKSAKEAAVCLEKFQSEKGVVIEGRRAAGYLAVSRKQALSLKGGEVQLPEKQDKRNLRLLKFGHIKKGTVQAKNMSEADSEKRAQLASASKKKLKNPVMFVSDVRLAVHNIPNSVNDAKLKQMAQDNAGNKLAIITECRIWRNAPETGNDPKKGKSKGFGFIAFKEHKDALFCLKQMNNNPRLFTDEKRPIVEFSVENLKALKARGKREQLPKGSKAV
uniref:RNA-binding protein 28 n=1 Tax=Rhabditophanes sp. KR3021 TaxID=114890 RepID=A0AC35TTG7_9BILA